MLRVSLWLLVCASLASCATPTREPIATSRASQSLGFEDYREGQIFLFRGKPSEYRRYLEFFPRDQIVEAVEFLRKRHAQDAIVSNESPHTVLFVRAAPIPDRASVATYLQFERESRFLNPYTFQYRGDDFGPPGTPLVILNELSAGGTGGNIHFRLVVADKVVSQSVVAIK